MIIFIMSEVKEQTDQTFMIDLYEAHKERMFKMVRRIIFEDDYVEDVVQEVLLNLYRNIATLRGLERCKLEAYIVYTVKNTAYNHNKKKKTEKLHMVLDDDEKIIHLLKSSDRYLEDELIRMDNLYRIRCVIKQLPAQEQDIIIRKYYLKQADCEIAQAHGMQTNSIRMKLTRIRRNILSIMKEEGIAYEIT